MQGVHIGAQADGAAGPVALAVQHPDDAGGGEAAVHLDAELGQLLGHEVGGAQLLESGLGVGVDVAAPRSEEHTSELQSLMRISYAVFCLKKKTKAKKLPQTK